MENLYQSSYFFLDDERTPNQVTWVEIPHTNWHIVRNYTDFVAAIMEYYAFYDKLPTHISFDHDLAWEHYRKSMFDADRHYNKYYTDGTFKEKTGFCAAKWLTEFCMKKDLDLPNYTVHTKNPIGRENIVSILESYRKFRESEKKT